jgi:hypothetical protein
MLYLCPSLVEEPAGLDDALHRFLPSGRDLVDVVAPVLLGRLKQFIAEGYGGIDQLIGGPLSADDAGDELAEQLTQEEYRAFAELVREVKAEAVAAGETRQMVLADIDTVIAECADASGS